MLADLKDGIFPLEREDYSRVLDVWHAAVRATHDFLSDADIAYLLPLVRDEYLDAVELTCMRDADGDVVGFAGVAEDKLEMLFVHPDWHGRGIGRRLTEHLVGEKGIRQVDVNEQNERAVGFYRRMGFEVVGRSDLDGLGLPFPLLHMQLSNQVRGR